MERVLVLGSKASSLTRTMAVCTGFSQSSFLHTSAHRFAGQNYRLSKGDCRSGTEYGVLTDGPDWSYFEDGSLAPQTKAQAKRQRDMERKEHRIAELLQQINKVKA
eukprot:m.111946 g.111946  ORF g.111946 m.111946 type:complete len:106 (-) comp12773_c0_seq6:374-691(-)